VSGPSARIGAGDVAESAIATEDLVEDHDIGHLGPPAGDGLGGIPGLEHPQRGVVELEQGPDERAHPLVVVDDEHACHPATDTPPMPTGVLRAVRRYGATVPLEPDDLHIGSFSDEPPWHIDPAELVWKRGLDAIRVATRRQVPVLTRRRVLPPGARVLVTGARLGLALGGWYLLERRSGDPSTSRAGLSRRLRKAFERLGPTYIKLGQIISSGDGIFPEELVGEFRLLRDKVPAEPFDVVRRTVEADLGRRLEDVFERFDRTPVAAASIAQVHAATLKTGEEVVVKVQRPTVKSMVGKDLAAMSWIAPSLVGRIPVSALANPPALVELFAETIVEELDFRLEAENMLDVAAVLATTGQRSIIVPRPHPKLVTSRVLVMERLDGFSFDDVAGMKAAGIDTSAVVRAGMVGFLEGAILFGVFHGDLHGGNLFVRRDGRVALLDYGITGRLSEPRRLAFLRLLMSGTINDPKGQLAALRDLGALPDDVDLDELVVELGIDQPIKDPTQMAPEELLADIRDITKKLLDYGAKMPKELMLFVKNMLFLDGALATLAPDVDLFGEIAHVATYFAEQHGERIAADTGIDPRAQEIDLDGMKASMGITTDVEKITHRDLQARREMIRKRMEEHRRTTGRRRRRS
jgi:ubiquinone biosynthesis protein